METIWLRSVLTIGSALVDFAQHYMPQLHFHWEPIDVYIWRSAVKSFKKRAARGPDGFSKQDLVHMPTEFTTQLLQNADRH